MNIFIHKLIASCVLSAFFLVSNGDFNAAAQEAELSIDNLITGSIEGTTTGLPLPRFVSLKAKRANMRVGPSLDHPVSWVYVKSDLPVEIIQEFELWRRIRDPDGQEGWVHHSLVTAKRNAIIAPWDKGDFFTLYKQPLKEGLGTAKLQAGVQTEISQCNGKWCRVKGNNYEGWIMTENLWGVYFDEIIE